MGDQQGAPKGTEYQPTERLQRLHGSWETMSSWYEGVSSRYSLAPLKYRESGGIRDLTGSPQITYFRSIFKRHTNFAIESIAQTFSGTVRFGSKVTSE